MKIPKILILISFLIFFTTSVIYAQQTATTEEGKHVILKPDGTWEYLKVEPKSSDTKFNFRKTYWGMNKSQVKSSENNKIQQDENDILAYRGLISGLDALIGYIFAQGKLVRAKYLFIPEHTNRNDYIFDFNTIKESLIQKYGKPKEDDQIWRDELYKNRPSEWGFAVSCGHLVYQTSWETEDTTILLLLNGDNFKIQLGTEYCSKSLEKLEKNKRSQKSRSEF